MALDTFLYARLAAHSGTAALVGTRIYPGPLPQDATLPAITYRQVSGVHEHAMGADVMQRPHWQVTAWADDDPGARALRIQVLDALSRFRGTVGSDTVQDIFAINDGIDGYDPERRISGIVMEFRIWYRG